MFVPLNSIDDELYMKFIFGYPWCDYIRNIKEFSKESETEYNIYVGDISKFESVFPKNDAEEHNGKYYYMLYCELDGPSSTFDYILMSNNNAFTVHFDDEGKILDPDAEFELSTENTYRFI